MKIQTAVHATDTQGMAGAAQFRVEMNAHMASILSDKLYSDKIGAVIREYSCNAWDVCGSNFTVYAPTSLNPSFRVRDNGPGMAHEDMVHFLTGYGATNKTHTNKQIGGFGLGMKSFLAKTNTATFTNIHKGEKRIYTATRGSAGVPEVHFTEAFPTTEPSGIEVSVPVLQNEIGEWEKKIRKFFMYWKDRPVIKNVFSVPIIRKSELAGDGYMVMPSLDDGSVISSAILVGQVAYPFDMNAIHQSPHCPDEVKALLNMNILLTMPIGSVDIAASREALSYDDRTVMAIIARLTRVADDIRKHIKALFVDCKTLWEVKCRMSEFSSKGSYIQRLATKFAMWNGANVLNSSVKITGPDVSVLSAPTSYLGEVKMFRRYCGVVDLDSDKAATSFGASANTQIIRYDLDDITMERRLVHRYGDPSTRDTHQVIVIKADDATFARVLKDIGDPPYISLSSLPLPPPAPRKKAVKKVFVWDWSRNLWVEKNVDFSQDHIYVRLHSRVIMAGTIEVADSKEAPNFFDTCVKAGVINSGDEIVGIPAMSSKLIEDHDDTLTDLCRLVQKRLDDTLEDALKRIANKEAFDRIASDRRYRLINLISNAWPALNVDPGPLLTMGRSITHRYRTDAASVQWANTLRNLASYIEYPVKEVAPVTDLRDLQKWYEDVSVAHPLLIAMSDYHIPDDRKFVRDIVNYYIHR